MKVCLIICLTALQSISIGLSQTDIDRTIDSLKSITESKVSDTIKISAYNTWDNLIYVSDPDLDFELNEKIIDLSDKNLLRSNLSQTEYLFYYKHKCISHNNLGLLLLDFGDFINALENFHLSLTIGEALNDTTLMANATNNLGMLHNIQGDIDKSLGYYLKSMELDGWDNLSRSIYLNNIAMCYSDMYDDKRAFENYFESLRLAIQESYFIGAANTYGNIGELHFRNQEYDSAMFYFLKGIEIYKSEENVNGHVYLLHRLGLLYWKKNDPLKAKNTCLKALDILGDEKSIKNSVLCHECLYKAYKDLNNDTKALHHYESFRSIQDSMLNFDKKEELMQNEFQFEYEKKRISDSLEIATTQKVKEVKLEADIARKDEEQFFLFIGLGVLLLLGGISFRSYRLKKRDNLLIEAQKSEVESQKNIVEEKNREITDSITYAKRIQDAILPPDWFVEKLLPESFILYKPKDIVAGDFYWVEKVDDHVFFAAADCTGHGVPGAMVSVVCHNALNRSIREFGLIMPNEILDKTRDLVIETFEKSDKEVKDGMDIALCALNTKDNILNYSGANNSLFYLRNGELHEIKADKQPIGKHINNQSFNSNQLKLIKNDIIYIFSDGYADQFGGEKGKKFKYKNLKKLLVKSSSHTMDEQKSILDSEFEKWKGPLEQLDDVCVIGVKI